MTKLRVLDMFSGIGGFSLGLHRSGGFDTIAFAEIDPYASKVFAKRFPGVPNLGDVTTAEYPDADFITAGFPCQDISFAGAGAGLAGERSGLWREVVRAIRLVRPRGALLENVAALLGRGLDTVLGDLAEVGYDAEWHCIPAAAVGAPHRRDRIWIITHPRGEQHKGSRAPLSGEIAAKLLSANSLGHAGSAASERNAGTVSGEEGQEYSQGQQHGPLPDGPEYAGAGGRKGPVADTARELRNRCGVRAEQGGRAEPANGGEELADAGCDDAQGKFASGAHAEERQEPGERPPGPCGDGLGWWAVEPNVGRVAHGIPKELDGDLDAEKLDAEGCAALDSDPNALRELRRRWEAGEASPGLFGPGEDRGSMPAMPSGGRHSGRTSENEVDARLRIVRGALHAETQQEAHALRTRLPGREGAHQRDEALASFWAEEPSDVPRVAHGVAKRVDRLRCLGNAVVPQIPELIGRAILASLEQRKAA